MYMGESMKPHIDRVIDIPRGWWNDSNDIDIFKEEVIREIMTMKHTIHLITIEDTNGVVIRTPFNPILCAVAWEIFTVNDIREILIRCYIAKWLCSSDEIKRIELGENPPRIKVLIDEHLANLIDPIRYVDRLRTDVVTRVNNFNNIQALQS